MAHNSQRKNSNAAGHAEINAIQKAGEKLGNKNLDGSTIYCTCEPCIMCLSAIIYAKIDCLVYGLNLSDVSPKNKMITIDIDTFLNNAPRKLKVVQNFMHKECKKLL